MQFKIEINLDKKHQIKFPTLQILGLFHDLQALIQLFMVLAMCSVDEEKVKDEQLRLLGQLLEGGSKLKQVLIGMGAVLLIKRPSGTTQKDILFCLK